MSSERTAVLVDGDAPPDLVGVARAVRAALRVPEEVEQEDAEGSGIALPVAEEDAPEPSLDTAHVAIVLDGPSSIRARNAGVPKVVALLPWLSARWEGGDLDADLVLVPHRALIDDVVAAGAARDRVRVVGAVAPMGWAPADDRAALREKLGSRVDAPWIVVRVHVFDRDDLAPALVQLSLVSAHAVWLFDVGLDADFARVLRRRVIGYGLDALMFAEGPDALSAYQAADVVLGRLEGAEAMRAFAVGASLVTPKPRPEQLGLAHVIETAGLATIADAAATLSVTLEGALAPAALERSRANALALDAASGAARVADAVRALLAEERSVASIPAGLPRGFERISEHGDGERPAPRAPTPPPDDLDASVDAELAALRKKLGL